MPARSLHASMTAVLRRCVFHTDGNFDETDTPSLAFFGTQAQSLAWRYLSADQLRKLTGLSLATMPSTLAQMLKVEQTDRSALELDLFAHTIKLARDLQLTDEKASCLFSIVKQAHTSSIKNRCDPAARLLHRLQPVTSVRLCFLAASCSCQHVFCVPQVQMDGLTYLSGLYRSVRHHCINHPAVGMLHLSTLPPSIVGCCRLTVKRSFYQFKEWMLQHSVQRPPFSVGVFSLEEMKLIVDWMLESYYRHYKLYMYAFTDRYVCWPLRFVGCFLRLGHIWLLLLLLLQQQISWLRTLLDCTFCSQFNHGGVLQAFSIRNLAAHHPPPATPHLKTLAPRFN